MSASTSSISADGACAFSVDVPVDDVDVRCKTLDSHFTTKHGLILHSTLYGGWKTYYKLIEGAKDGAATDDNIDSAVSIRGDSLTSILYRRGPSGPAQTEIRVGEIFDNGYSSLGQRYSHELLNGTFLLILCQLMRLSTTDPSVFECLITLPFVDKSKWCSLVGLLKFIKDIASYNSEIIDDESFMRVTPEEFSAVAEHCPPSYDWLCAFTSMDIFRQCIFSKESVGANELYAFSQWCKKQTTLEGTSTINEQLKIMFLETAQHHVTKWLKLPK
jgi:hypothetical protein